MNQWIAVTDFLPPDRISWAAAKERHQEVMDWPPIRAILEDSIVPLAIFNEQRQLIYGNPAFLNSLDTLGHQDPVGQRTGELWNCVQSAYAPAGCGTTFVCRTCRVANALVDAMKWGEGEGYTTIRRQHVPALDVEIHIAAFTAANERWLLCRFGEQPYLSPQTPPDSDPPPEAPPEPPNHLADLYTLLTTCGQI